MKRFFSFCLSACLMVLAVSCGPKPEEQVKDFALRFGDFVNTNQKDSVQKYYPEFETTDSLVSVPVGNITLSPQDIEGSYLVEYSPSVSMLVYLNKEGAITITESKGLLAFNPKGIELVKNADLWKENLRDSELKQLVVEQIRQDSIEQAQKLMKAMPNYSTFFDKDGWFKDAEKIATQLTSLGYEREGKFSKKRNGSILEGGGIITLTYNWEGKPYVTIKLELASSYDEIEEVGGFSEEFIVTFLKDQDAEKFYKELKSKNINIWGGIEKNNNTITLSDYGD